jgi:hypothetical protein
MKSASDRARISSSRMQPMIERQGVACGDDTGGPNSMQDQTWRKPSSISILFLPFGHIVALIAWSVRLEPHVSRSRSSYTILPIRIPLAQTTCQIRSKCSSLCSETFKLFMAQ